MDKAEARTLAAALVGQEAGSAFRTGLDLLRGDYPEILLPAARRLSDRNRADAKLAQLLGLAARAAGEGPLAHAAFARAARLAPTDPLIAHSHARTALEAGQPAADLFERAVTMAPHDGTVLLGMTAALVAERRGDEAIAWLTEMLQRNPLWLEGHRALAHVSGQLGLDPITAIDRAIAAHPANQALHHLRVTTLLEARRHRDAAAALIETRGALGDALWIERMAGHIASELGEIDHADRVFASAGPPGARDDVALLARHLLRAGRPAEASELLESPLADDRDQLFWPYRSLAWRMLGDPRCEWLEGDGSLVGVYDVANRVGDLGALADHLRGLHFASEPPLDQSVRGGTQTDGNLLLRDEEPVRHLREVLLETVAEHVAQLPPARQGHPTLLAHREPQRIAGSWSVRLKDAGFHTDHVHSQGWLSSAFYVALPETLGGGEDRAGWLSLGESRDLVPSLPALRLVEPKPGRLVLFPSTLWHGTRPFPDGERLTVAFDIALPKQS